MLQSTATTFVGLDVSKASISVALVRPGGSVDEDRIPHTPEAVRALVRRWANPSTVRACYQAGPTGYALYRRLTALGVDTTVIAPSLTPRRPGERVKADRRDARKLVGLFRAGELTAVRVPTPDEEAVRDLLRARQDLKEDILRSRHRLSKFLLRRGRVYGTGRAWTLRHLAWVAAQRFAQPAAQRTLDHYRASLEMRLTELRLLDAELLEIAAAEPWRARVARLTALRGIATLSALTLAAEVGDLHPLRQRAELHGLRRAGAFGALVRRAAPAGRHHEGRRRPPAAHPGRGRLARPTSWPSPRAPRSASTPVTGG